ncbi:MAG TPA: hypothetical protein DCL77_20195 [Prolixibacteraceae bacterium]|jgi:uncharacterized surface protein with fasciclin (FAS1) repeats|nr:hypothetical protein [Prolixibacteraceae bacterium]
MKRISILLNLLVVCLLLYSCKQTEVPNSNFKDQEKYTIYGYLLANQDQYSSFLQILQVGGLDKTLSAYNPGGKTHGYGYTLFLPDNTAVDDFIKGSDGQYNSLNDLLNDQPYCEALARYHILNKEVFTYDFPFGTFDQPNLSSDFLNVNFDVQPDTTYYKINNQARVIKANIKTSNGYIQVVGTMLKPIIVNSYGWLKKNAAFSIFTAALEATEWDKVINVDMKLEDQTLQPFTMLVEPDSVYHKRNINSLEDLEASISPGRTDYTNSSNPLNLFIGYHLLTGSHFLDNLAKNNTNYTTFADVPMAINGLGLDIAINKTKEIFVDENQDSTDYVGIYYDQSNVNTQSGAIHFVNQILKPQTPSRAIVDCQFWDEGLIANYRNTQWVGTLLIEDHSLLKNVKWNETKLIYVRSSESTETAWDKDYFLIEGNFTISYTIPKIIQGKYNVFLQAHFLNIANATVEVMMDGTKLGGLVDLSKGGNAGGGYWGYPGYKVGSVDFKKYENHTIEIKSLIPGRFIWDYIRFEPI